MFDLLFPTYCIECGRPGEYLCTLCKKKLRKSLPECYVCRKISNRYMTHKCCKNNNINAVFVGWQYDNISKKILSEFKYKYAYKLSVILSDLLLERLKATNFIELFGVDPILIPVPIHKSHSNLRGFNQSSLIAKNLSKLLGCEFREDIISRVKDSNYQSQATLKDRKSLGEVFQIKNVIKGRNIVIVDDVITTGTTINRVAKELNDNNVNAIALFRGRPRYQ